MITGKSGNFQVQVNEAPKNQQKWKLSPKRQQKQELQTYSKEQIIRKIVRNMVNDVESSHHLKRDIVKQDTMHNCLLQPNEVMQSKIGRYISQLESKNLQLGDTQVQMLQPSQYIKLLNHQKKVINKRRWSRLMALNQGYSITFDKLQKEKLTKNINIKSDFKMQQEDFRYYLMLISQAHYLKLENAGYYQILYSQKDRYPEHYFGPIQKDIPRTLSSKNPFQQPLRRVLITYAIRNPPLLYCQGMNYLVSYLLINSFSEEDCFWFLSILIENILPKDFYRDLGTISISSLVFNDLISAIFPDFSERLQSIGVDTSMFLVSWYICLFTKGFINAVSFFLLSTIILQSRNYEIGYILVSISLAIIWVIQNRDVSSQIFIDTDNNQHLGNSRDSSMDPRNFKDNFDTSVFQISLREIRQALKMINLDYRYFMVLFNCYSQKRQQKVRKTMEKQMQKNSEKWINQTTLESAKQNQQILKIDCRSNMFTLPVCKEQYPICLHRIQIEKKVGDVQEVNIFTSGKQISSIYIQNYFQEQSKANNEKMIEKNNIQKSLDKQAKIGRKIQPVIQDFKDCLFYRRQHICSGINRQQRMRKDVLKKGRMQFQNQQDYSQKQARLAKKNRQSQRLFSQDIAFLNIHGNCYEIEQLNQFQSELQQKKQIKTFQRKKIFAKVQQQKNRQEELMMNFERQSRFATVEDRFTQLSQYFVVDPQFLSRKNIQEDQFQGQPQYVGQKQITKKQLKKQEQGLQESRFAIVGGAIKKVLAGLKLFKKQQQQK